MAKKWTREEEILALKLYCELPFGKVHASTKEVQELAVLLKRSSASVSMKMCNFARFDPTLRSRGVSGLTNGSKLDETVWEEFNGRWAKLIEESRSIVKEMTGCSNLENGEHETVKLTEMPEGLSRNQVAEVRVNQSFFRKAVLSAYETKCCISGLTIPELLVASHIKPWNVSDPICERVNPANGLCLNPLYDKAFDRGLITVKPDLTIVVSRHIEEMYSNVAVKQYFECINGKEICKPVRFIPDPSFLEYHNDVVFRR